MTRRVVERLLDAINEHDLEAMTACFAPDFVNVWPAHPERSFTGRDRVRTNWEQVFAERTDVAASVSAQASAGNDVWGEWEFVGVFPDGTRWHQRGVIVVTVEDDRIVAGRFFMEPVTESLDGVKLDANNKK